MLTLTDNLKLSLDVVTEKLAWLGRTGSGKTYGAMKLAELMLDAGAQIGVLDPVGVWRGLRVPAQKGGTSYDVVVFGGLYGDLPLQPTAGVLIADVVCDRGISFVLDVSQFIPAEQQRFAKAFAERFFQRRKAAPAAIHLFLEECQEFLPQNPMGSEAETLHEFQRLWKIGRNFGIGGSLISQRPQEVNKKALNMTGTLFAFQMMAPQERKAVREWVADHGVAEDIIGQLQKLEVGEPHVESPMFLQVSKTVRILPRVTADLSSTPKVGVSKVATRTLTPIDVEQLKAAMSESIEKAKVNDPRELLRRIAELERQLKGKSAVAAVPSPAVKEKRVKVPVLKDGQIARVEKLVDRFDKALNVAMKQHAAMCEPLQQLISAVNAVSRRHQERPTAAPMPPIAAPLRQMTGSASPAYQRRTIVDGAAVTDGYLPTGEKATLIAAAQYPNGITREQASILTGYKRSSRDAYIQRLLGKGYVEIRGGYVCATDAGVAAIGSDYEPLPTGRALQRYWIERLPPGEKAVLAVALTVYPEDVDVETVDAQAGYKRSSRDAYIQRLVARQLVTRGRGTVRASAVLFDE